MMVILEGSDQAGKTTLAKQLLARLGDGWEYHHEGPPPPGGEANHYAKMVLLDRQVVLDRSHLGEMVYGPCCRGKAALTPLQVSVLNRIVAGRGGFVIWCDPPLGLIKARWKEDVTEKKPLKQLCFIHDTWNYVLRGAARELPVIRYTATTPAEGVDFVERIISRICASAALGTQAGAINIKGYGSHRARMILVGEKVNPRATWLGLPFDQGASSEFLHGQLLARNIQEKDLYFVNVDRLEEERDDQETLPFLMFRNPMAKIVALGKIAGAGLRRLGFCPAYDLPHPQSWVRFHSKEKNQYGKMLREVYDA